MKVVGERPHRKKRQHLSQETIAERSKIKQRCPSSGFNRSEYSLANKRVTVKKSCKKDEMNSKRHDVVQNATK